MATGAGAGSAAPTTTKKSNCCVRIIIVGSVGILAVVDLVAPLTAFAGMLKATEAGYCFAGNTENPTNTDDPSITDNAISYVSIGLYVIFRFGSRGMSLIKTLYGDTDKGKSPAEILVDEDYKELSSHTTPFVSKIILNIIAVPSIAATIVSAKYGVTDFFDDLDNDTGSPTTFANVIGVIAALASSATFISYVMKDKVCGTINGLYWLKNSQTYEAKELRRLIRKKCCRVGIASAISLISCAYFSMYSGWYTRMSVGKVFDLDPESGILKVVDYSTAVLAMFTYLPSRGAAILKAFFSTDHFSLSKLPLSTKLKITIGIIGAMGAANAVLGSLPFYNAVALYLAQWGASYCSLPTKIFGWVGVTASSANIFCLNVVDTLKNLVNTCQRVSAIEAEKETEQPGDSAETVSTRATPSPDNNDDNTDKPHQVAVVFASPDREAPTGAIPVTARVEDARFYVDPKKITVRIKKAKTTETWRQYFARKCCCSSRPPKGYGELAGQAAQ